ncbi:nitrate reductase large subunit protein [Fulvimarina pelagi HTCC2506]|uniref:Nitrate reductase large subunit protein n=1 Tax=Fulvimarina pelagi HTCC2506 TaxID=314231 RepID=Q0G439_9HYPH|nr:nitrate reductase [Fulvimarina pelagi]EAU41642.1 nitrate reductase large subunit protein [Fulvimarina pelagi HTCC2506]
MKHANEIGRTVRTTCAYCGVGCGVLATPEGNGLVKISGDPNHPANYGRLCSKGSALGETLGLEERVLHPMIGGARADWENALDLVASRFTAAIEEHGPDSVAFYLSGQLLTEDYYVANKLMKGFIGSANIDTNSRLCMASSVAGHKRAFGSDTVPGTYEDLEKADLVVLTGSNLAWCHPVIFQRIAAAKAERPEMSIVVIDPRRTATCEIADMHLAIRADGDVALFSGLLNALAENGAIDCDYIGQHTEGFVDAMRESRSMRLRHVSERTGLGPEEIRAFYELFKRNKKVVTVYSQGVNQSASGTDKVNAIINCHLATGRIGRPGMGPFSVTGQPNAMGGREVGGLSNMLAAHMELGNAEDRARVKSFWNAPRIAEKSGFKAVELFEAAADGKIKALWIAGTNPVVSMPDADAVKRALEACPFVVVSDVIAETDTTPFADVLLPAAAWGEKNGTVTNSERRISRQRPFLPLPGEARPDWTIFADVARRMGFAGFDYRSASEVFDEHARLSGVENDGARDFDIGGLAGLSEAEYDLMAPVQWPLPAGRVARETRFFAKGGFYHGDRRARFVAVKPPKPEETADFTLNTGRVRDHWHTMTRTGLSARLSAHIAEPFAEIHPADAERLGIAAADLVEVASPQGSAVVRALITDRQRPGNVFVAMHWTSRYAPSARIGAVAHSATDRASGQPALKSTAATVKRFEAAWHGFAILTSRPDLDAIGRHAAYTATARTEGGWRLELAGANPLGDAKAFALALFGEPEADIVGYRDARAGTERFAVFFAEKLLGALYLSPQPVAVSRNWAVAQLGLTDGAVGSRAELLAGRGPADRPDPGPIVCSCFAVGVNQISALVVSGEAVSVEAVGKALNAGSNCGSCRSEIKGIIENVRVKVPG